MGLTERLFIVILIGIFVWLSIKISAKFDIKKKYVGQNISDRFILAYNSWIKNIFGICFGFFFACTILCGIQVLDGRESILTFLLWLFVFSIPTAFAWMITLLEELIFTENTVTFRNKFGIKKTWNINEIELYEFKNNISAFVDGKRVFKACEDPVQTIEMGNWKLNVTKHITYNHIKLNPQLGLLDKPYVLKLVKYGRVQTCTEDKVVFIVMFLLGVFLEYIFLTNYDGSFAAKFGVVFCICYCLWCLCFITKKVVLHEDELILTKCFIFRKKYRFDELTVKESQYRFRLYDIKKGRRMIVRFSEKDPNAEELVSVIKAHMKVKNSK